MRNSEAAGRLHGTKGSYPDRHGGQHMTSKVHEPTWCWCSPHPSRIRHEMNWHYQIAWHWVLSNASILVSRPPPEMVHHRTRWNSLGYGIFRQSWAVWCVSRSSILWLFLCDCCNCFIAKTWAFQNTAFGCCKTTHPPSMEKHGGAWHMRSTQSSFDVSRRRHWTAF